MGELINFPTADIREWSAIEKTLKTIMKEAGASPKMESHILSRMKEAFEKHKFAFTLSFGQNWPTSLTPEERELIITSISDQLNNFSLAFHEHTNELLIARLYLEIELYNAIGIHIKTS